MTPEQAYLWAREYLDDPANMINGQPINEAVHVAAGLVIKNGTVYNANGVPVVDINKPNGSGLSHNIWDNLNVDKNGVVFNNSGLPPLLYSGWNGPMSPYSL